MTSEETRATATVGALKRTTREENVEHVPPDGADRRARASYTVLAFAAAASAALWLVDSQLAGLVLLHAASADWVAKDLARRGGDVLAWTIATAVFGPVVLAFHLACRNLLAGEVRAGARGWNVIRWLILEWVGVGCLAIVAILAECARAGWLFANRPDADASAGFTAGLVLVSFLILWLPNLLALLILGLLFRRKGVIEEGPPTSVPTAAPLPSAPYLVAGGIGILAVAGILAPFPPV